ncbi:MAG TPA: NAD(P)-dependent alcohol dehydrogenase [Gaiellales bacterium]
MKAIVQTTYGPPDVLELADVDAPVAADDELLIRVEAAGVDRGVWHFMTGTPYLVRLASGLRAPRQHVPGMDAAGVVEAVGKDVTGFQPGDEVYGSCAGAFARYARARPQKIAPKPANLTFAQAAAVPVSACAALQALRDRGRVQPGQTVLVIGAGGGVGTFAVQLAKGFGAHVTGVCSTAKVDLVRSLGADEVVDHTQNDFAQTRRRHDLILDIAGNASLRRLRAALAPRGTLVIVGGEGGGRVAGGIDRQLRAQVLSPFVGQRLGTFIAGVSHADLLVLTGLIEAGTVAPVVEATYPLADAAEALRRLEQGRVAGKVVIAVGDAVR